MMRLAILLVALLLPAGLAAQEAGPVLPDDAPVVSCYLEQSEWKDDKPLKPSGKEAKRYVTQFDQSKTFSPATAREHDPNALMEGARMTAMQLIDTPQGEAIILHGPLTDCTRIVLTMVRGEENEAGFFASQARRSAGGVGLINTPFLTGRCKLWRVQGGANLLWEGFLKSEPTLKLGQK
jgi:hypothetical protein